MSPADLHKHFAEDHAGRECGWPIEVEDGSIGSCDVVLPTAQKKTRAHFGDHRPYFCGPCNSWHSSMYTLRKHETQQRHKQCVRDVEVIKAAFEAFMHGSPTLFCEMQCCHFRCVTERELDEHIFTHRGKTCEWSVGDGMVCGMNCEDGRQQHVREYHTHFVPA
ncbi:hypothetical protein HMN09_00442500 [Mycena chlorophos]|uniref:Uncharacterized protein n=1 Tax=Mycena chlorophos TaxID=658473 RepID=A0A8H6WLS6_MYCCL|nr:hypothetical protein HMN09_00442500 [Mycena chlorophos]